IAEIAGRVSNIYISPNSFAEATVYQFCLAGDMDRSIAVVCRALAERAAELASALRRHIPGCQFNEPAGGYFLWVELPDDVLVDPLVPAAARRGVPVVKGTDFLLEGGDHALRMAYSAVRTEEIDEGIRRLAAAIDDVCRG